jgi:hypothetical protein
MVHGVREMSEIIPAVEKDTDLLLPPLLQREREKEQCPADGLPVLREDKPSRQREAGVLRQDMREQMGSDSPEKLKGRADQGEHRIHTNLEAGASLGATVGVRDGAPANHGEEARPSSVTGRGSPSQKQGHDGQPDKQSGSDGEAGARRFAEPKVHGDMSGVRVRVPGSRTCSHCGCELAWQPLKPRPCEILDCFGGAGTVALVADRLGRDATLIELNPAYVRMAEKRMRADCPLFTQVEIVP